MNMIKDTKASILLLPSRFHPKGYKSKHCEDRIHVTWYRESLHMGRIPSPDQASAV